MREAATINRVFWSERLRQLLRTDRATSIAKCPGGCWHVHAELSSGAHAGTHYHLVHNLKLETFAFLQSRDAVKHTLCSTLVPRGVHTTLLNTLSATWNKFNYSFLKSSQPPRSEKGFPPVIVVAVVVVGIFSIKPVPTFLTETLLPYLVPETSCCTNSMQTSLPLLPTPNDNDCPTCFSVLCNSF